MVAPFFARNAFLAYRPDTVMHRESFGIARYQSQIPTLASRAVVFIRTACALRSGLRDRRSDPMKHARFENHLSRYRWNMPIGATFLRIRFDERIFYS
jgi:hypothetical protein